MKINTTQIEDIPIAQVIIRLDQTGFKDEDGKPFDSDDFREFLLLIHMASFSLLHYPKTDVSDPEDYWLEIITGSDAERDNCRKIIDTIKRRYNSCSSGGKEINNLPVERWKVTTTSVIKEPTTKNDKVPQKRFRLFEWLCSKIRKILMPFGS